MLGLGLARVSADSFALEARDVRDGPGLYFQGTVALNGGQGNAFGDGLRCVGGTLVRLGFVVAASGASTIPTASGPTSAPLSVAGGVVPGSTLHYQLWYRDSAAFCTGATYNLTNAVKVLWAPWCSRTRVARVRRDPNSN